MINFNIVRALIKKDLKLFFKNKFITVITIIGIAFYFLIFFLSPKTVQEVIEIGVYSTKTLPAIESLQNEGLKIEKFKKETDLVRAVEKGEIVAGLSIPADIIEKIIQGDKVAVKIYVLSELDTALRNALSIFVKELFFMQTGKQLNIDFKTEILGLDMIGKQVAPRLKMIPLLVFFIILMEIFGLAILISEEIEKKTIQALLVTPVRAVEIFISKGITGLITMMPQVFLFLIVVGGLRNQPLTTVLFLFIGGLMIIGISFLIGSITKGFMGVIAWMVLVLIILIIPAINLIIPGAFVTDWIKIIPTYYFTDSINKVMNYGYGWKDVWTNSLILLGYSLGFLSMGVYALNRRFR